MVWLGAQSLAFIAEGVSQTERRSEEPHVVAQEINVAAGLRSLGRCTPQNSEQHHGRGSSLVLGASWRGWLPYAIDRCERHKSTASSACMDPPPPPLKKGRATTPGPRAFRVGTTNPFWTYAEHRRQTKDEHAQP